MFKSENRRKGLKNSSESTQAPSRNLWFLECLTQNIFNERTLMADVLDSGGDVRLMSTTSPLISYSQGGGSLLGAEHRGDEARSFWAMISKTTS